MDSSIPWARGPQAAVCASRVASASDAADAVAVFRAFPKATATVHSTCWEPRVDQSRNPAKATTTSRVRSFPRLVTPASWRLADAMGQGWGTGYRTPLFPRNHPPKGFGKVKRNEM